MKKNIILAVALMAMTTLGLVSCDKSSPKMDDKSAATSAKSSEGRQDCLCGGWLNHDSVHILQGVQQDFGD